MKKVTKPHIVIPILISLCIISVALKKLGVPFASAFLILAFDGMAIYFLLDTFQIDRRTNDPDFLGIGFKIDNIAYAICSVALLYRLQEWNGGDVWSKV